MSIKIHQVYSKIGVQTKAARILMQNSPSRLQLHQNQAQISMKIDSPRILIDQYPCFATSGLKNDKDMLLAEKQKAYQSVMSYIKKTAEDGKRLRAIENGGNVIASIAKRDSHNINQFGLVSMPSAAPEISVVRGTVSISLASTNNGLSQAVEGNYLSGQLNMQYDPYDVNIYVLQKPSIEMEYKPD